MKEAPRNIRVVVTQSVEPIDFDAWAERYIAALIEADRAARAQAAAA